MNYNRNKKIVNYRRIISALDNAKITNKDTHFRRLRSLIINKGFKFQRPSHEVIASAYEIVLDILKDTYPERFETTTKQRYFENQIKKHTSLTFYTNYPIGHRPMDIFLPSIITKGKGMKGLVLEIDGKSHDRQLKMMRDEKNGEILGALGVAHTVIRNGDTSELTVRNLLKGTKNQYDRASYRTKRNILRRAQLYTLVTYLGPRELAPLYKVDRAIFEGEFKRHVDYMYSENLDLFKPRFSRPTFLEVKSERPTID